MLHVLFKERDNAYLKLLQTALFHVCGMCGPRSSRAPRGGTWISGRDTINADADAGMLCCTRNSGDPETTLQSLDRIDDGSTRLGHAASILWASADGQDPAATSCIGLNRTECRCLSHSVRGRRVWRMLPPHGGRKAEYARLELADEIELERPGG